ncbi:MAG: DUF2007 domain-containing protein [Ignavibacteria bacterium]|jgi:hypothetical protein|nr:DUF2007 domain-containing protein [Ignavibacteria bacterium]
MENLDNEKLVTVFKSGNEALIALAKSILDEANIQYLIKNEGVQDLLGIGVFGTGFNPITGPVQIQVLPADADYAVALLGDVGSATPFDEGKDDYDDNADEYDGESDETEDEDK